MTFEPVQRTTALYLFDLAPGMYAAHRDSVDSATYLSASPRPIRTGTVPLYVQGSGLVVIYRTGGIP